VRPQPANPQPQQQEDPVGKPKPKKVDFAVYETNKNAAYTMAYNCFCGKPVIGYSDDMKGLFAGLCENDHPTSVFAS
jgi:hypothetical protein